MITQAVRREDSAAEVSATSPAAAPKTVLMISYAFPPEAYVGSQRTLKYCKYLGGYGWRSIVITIQPRLTAFQDENLCRQLPADTIVLRTRDFDADEWVQRLWLWWHRRRPSAERSNVRPASPDAGGSRPLSKARWLTRLKAWMLSALLDAPDPHILWVPIAFLRGARVLLTHRVDVIYSSSPPHSAHVAAFLLAKCFRKPHVVDFRDPWIVKGSKRPPGSPQSALLGLQAWVKKRILANAAKVVVVTPGEPADLVAEFPRLPARRIAVITNGYDPDDFSDAAPGSPDPSHLTFTHTGTIYPQTGHEFFEAIESVIEKHPMLRHTIRVNLVGVNDASRDSAVHRLESAGVVRVLGPQPHSTALRWARQSDVLLLFARGGTHAASHIPAKVFEYLFIGKPILAIVGPGVLRTILTQSRLGIVAAPGDVQAVEASILSALMQRRSDTLKATPDMSYISRFERRALTAAFADVLAEAATR